MTFDGLSRARLLIEHDSADLRFLKSIENVEPVSCQIAGKTRTSRSGHEIGGVYTKSKWSGYILAENFDRDVLNRMNDINKVVSVLIAKVKNEGICDARYSLIFNVSGAYNQFLEVNSQILSNLNYMNVNFAVEIFPHWTTSSADMDTPMNT